MTIDDIKERRKKITEGPWWHENDWSLTVDSKSKRICNLPDRDDKQDNVNARFIAHAPAAIDWLIAEVERFNKNLREAVNAHCTCGGDGPEDGCVVCKVYHEIERLIKLEGEDHEH